MLARSRILSWDGEGSESRGSALHRVEKRLEDKLEGVRNILLNGYRRFMFLLNARQFPPNFSKNVPQSVKEYRRIVQQWFDKIRAAIYDTKQKNRNTAKWAGMRKQNKPANEALAKPRISRRPLRVIQYGKIFYIELWNLATIDQTSVFIF